MKVLTPLDLNKNELRNAVIQVLASAPSSPLEGQVYYDSTLHQLGYRTNTTWVYSADAEPVYADGALFVSGTNGSDSTGAVGRVDLPYKTLAAAQTAASSGQTVNVNPASYTVVSLGKNGVGWSLAPGTVMTTAGGTDSVFSDGGSAMSFSVDGCGDLTLAGLVTTDWTAACVRVTNASSNVSVRARQIANNTTSTSVSASGACVYQTAGTVYVDVDVVSLNGGAYTYALWWTNGNMRVVAKDFVCPAAPQYLIVAACTATPTGDMTVDAQTIEVAANLAVIQHASTQATATLWITADSILNTSVGDNPCVVLDQSGGKTYITAQKIAGALNDEGNSGAVIQVSAAASASQLWLTAQKITATYEGALLITGGTVRASVQHIEDLGHMYQVAKVTGGTLWLEGVVVDCATGDGIVCSGGTVHLSNCHIITHGGGKFDLKQSGGGAIVVHPGCTGTNADGSFVTSGTITYLPQRVDASATPTFNGLSANSQKITSLANGTASSDAATYGQVLAAVNGLDWKNPVACVATSNLSLTGEQTVDGVTTSTSRILLTGQSTTSQNGIYVTASGAWARAADLASGVDAADTAVFVEQGTTYSDTMWLCTSNTGSAVVGTNNLAFVQFAAGSSYSADESTLHLTGSTFSIKSTYAGQTSIATLGTVTVGTWHADVIGSAYGGAGAVSGIMKANGSGTVSAAGAADIRAAGGTGKYSALIGNGASTSIAITQGTHALASDGQMTVQLFDASTGAMVFTDIAINNSNGTVTLTFTTAPASNAYRVVIVG